MKIPHADRYLILGLLAAPALSAPLAPEMLSASDPAWEDLRRLELCGALPAGITTRKVTSSREAPRR